MHLKLGLIGHPVSHSLSPLLHKAALAHYGIAGSYDLIDVPAAELHGTIQRLTASNYAGFNVTVPHKEKIITFMDDLTDEARSLQAVNTVKILPSGQLIGHNTDLFGFMAALLPLMPKCGARGTAMIIGAGGAARSAVWGLIKLGWNKIIIAARNTQAVQSIIAHIGQQAKSKVAPWTKSNESCRLDLIVNCTPIGLYDHFVPEWVSQLVDNLNADGFLFDMVYLSGGQKTAMIEQASRINRPACDGRSMLINQAALAFNYWTGKPSPTDIMQNVIGENH